MSSVLRSFVVFSLLAAATTGCGGGPSDQPDLATVSGTVTKGGAPLANAVVTFTPENGRQSSGQTDSDGAYTLMYTIDTEGAVPGKHSVLVTAGGGDEDYEEGGSTGEEQDSEPVQTEPLEVTVQAGSNTIDIPL